MRHVPKGNPFQASDPFPGASQTVRRALAQVNLESVQIKRVMAACQKLKLDAKMPFYIMGEDRWAHIGIPKHKVVLYMRGFGDIASIERKRESWEVRGWRMLAITHGSLDRVPDDALAAQLKEALKGVAK